MFKKGLGLGLGLVFILFCSFAFAEEESFTITTYYPSPYGSYNQLEVHRSVIYKPVDKDTLSDLQEGEVVYNAPDDSFYYYNGSEWVPQAGGGGGTVISLKCSFARYWTGTGYSGSASCTPPGCPSDWAPVGTGCANMGSSGPTYSFCGYCEQWCYKQ